MGREDHTDGGTHLHCFIDFGGRKHVRNERAFDVGVSHPNIQPVTKPPHFAFDYAIKDGDVVAGGLERPNEPKSTRGRVDYDFILLASTREEFFQRVRDTAPELLLKNHTSLQSYAEWYYRDIPEPYRHDRSLQFRTEHVPELDQWVDEYLENFDPGDVSKSFWVGPHVTAAAVASLHAYHPPFGGHGAAPPFECSSS